MSDGTEVLWNAVLIFLFASTLAYWREYLPITNVTSSILKKMGAERGCDNDGEDLPTEIYFTKYGGKYHVYPNCPSLTSATTGLRELHVCQVCSRRAREFYLPRFREERERNIPTPSSRDYFGPRHQPRGSPRERCVLNQVDSRCYWCGERGHVARNCPWRDAFEDAENDRNEVVWNENGVPVAQ